MKYRYAALWALLAGIALWGFHYSDWMHEIYDYPWPNFVAENLAFILVPFLLVSLIYGIGALFRLLRTHAR